MNRHFLIFTVIIIITTVSPRENEDKRKKLQYKNLDGLFIRMVKNKTRATGGPN